MNEDCLNSARPDQFLPMKNILKIKLLNETPPTLNEVETANATSNVKDNEASSEMDLRKQLVEAFQDINKSQD